MTFNVHWCARDLASSPVGNHQFILIYMDPIYGLPPFSPLEEKGIKFMTLGAFNVGGSLKFRENEPSDVQSVREFINPKKRGWFSDLDLAKHRVTPPLGSEQRLAETLVKQATAFKVKTQAENIKYSLANNNCSAWVNTMFKCAGVSLANRKSYGEFFGIDWGEEDLLEEAFFY